MTTKNKTHSLTRHSAFQKNKLARAVQCGSQLLIAGAIGWHSAGFAQDTSPSGQEPSAVLEEIVVSGQRSSIQSAQMIKQSAEQIVDSIVADDIGKLPDRSVTETLQRIPGVTIDHFMSLGDPEHFSAEGSGVAVRGLTQVRSELNGRDSFTANGGRSLSFEDVPAELMAGVDVYKNPSADMIEGGLGGTVNLRTRMPFDSDGQVMAATASVNYGDFIEEADPSVSALYSNRWDTSAGEFGVLVDVAFSEISTRTDGIFNRPFFPRDDLQGYEDTTIQVPRGADWRSMDFNRERLGTYLATQWRPNDTSEFYFQAFRSEYDMQWDEDAIFVQNDAYAIQPGEGREFIVDENNVFLSGRLTQPGGIPFGADIRVANRQSVTSDFSGGYKWTPSDQLEFSTDLQYTQATTEGLDATIATGINLPYIDIDLRGERPVVQADNDYLADPGNYYWGFTMPFIEDNEAEQFAWRADVKYNFNDTDVVRYVKTGVRATDREATNINSGYHWQAIYQPWMAWWKLPNDQMPPVEDPSQMSLNTFENFFRGKAPSPGVVYAPDISLIEGYPDSFDQLHADASENYICCDDYTPATMDDPSRINEQEEQTYAAYFLLGFGIDDWALPVDGNIGVRVVQTESAASGMIRYPETVVVSEDGETESRPWYQDPEDIVAENSYTNVLPNLNLKVELRDDLFLRFAASKAMARPAYSDMQAFQTLSADRPEGIPDDQYVPPEDFRLTSSSGSNPMLEPMEATQFDVSLEWYFDDAGGMAHVNAFSKDIDGFIRNQTIREEHGGWEYTVTRPVNTGTADIRGVELGWSQFFDQLPEPFDGLGMQANYTYIDSSTDVPRDEGSSPVDTDGSEYGQLPFEGLSEHSYNLVGMYEKGPLSIRLAYNWRSEFLMSVGPNGFNGTDRDITWRLPVYNDDYGQMDGSIFYDITDVLSVGLEVNNILNSETRTIMKQNAAGDHYASYFLNDTRYALTLRANF